MTNITSNQPRIASRRAVAPIIATLLLVAIAVVGGSIIFVFSQGFFSQAQVSGAPQIESLKIIGYDATDGTTMKIHDGTTPATLKGVSGNGVAVGERVAVYIQNNSVGKVTLNEVRFGGTSYTFVQNSAATLDVWTAPTTDGILGTPLIPSFVVLTKGPTTILSANGAELQPGQQATIILEAGETLKTGRDMQFKVATTNGAVFVDTVLVGQQAG
jgi:archaeal type IV pilus assembly protein PilA